MKISVTLPTESGRRAGRNYYRVHVEPNGSPLRYEYSFMQVEHDDGRHELVCMETAIKQLYDDPVEAQVDPEDVKQVTAAVVQDFKQEWTRYEHAARVTLASTLGDAELVARPRQRRVLSDEFLTDVVARHRAAERRGLQGTATVAREERVGTSTVRNWLRAARKRGIEGAS